jgi:hypothetical protein
VAERCLWLPLLQGLSIACSTEHAIKWDESWADSHEISGRAMVSVHDAQQHLQPDGHHAPPAPQPVGNGVSEVSAVHASCCGLVLYVHDAVRSLRGGHPTAQLANTQSRNAAGGQWPNHEGAAGPGTR